MLFKSNFIYLFFVLCFSPFLTSAEDIGINVHILKMNNYDLGKSLGVLRNSKVKYIRIDLPWSYVESEKGVYKIYPRWDFIINKVLDEGIKPILVLGYTNDIYGKHKPIIPSEIEAFSKYVSYVASHYNNKVFYYEIWNEWDSTLGGGNNGSVDNYGRLIKYSYTEIKKINQSNIVLGGGFTSNTFDKSEGLGNKDEINQLINSKYFEYLDVISIHTYTTSKPKSYDSYSYFLKKVNYVKTIILHSKYPNKKIFITEMGWSTANSGYAVSYSEQLYLLNKAICDSASLGISAFIIYDLVNDFKDNGSSGNNAAAYGLFKSDWSGKPSATLLKKIKCVG